MYRALILSALAGALAAGCVQTAAVTPHSERIMLTGESAVVDRQFSPARVMHSVRPGMSHLQVVQALGEPKAVIGTASTWFYAYEPPRPVPFTGNRWAVILQVEFEEGKVRAAEWLPRG